MTTLLDCWKNYNVLQYEVPCWKYWIGGLMFWKYRQMTWAWPYGSISYTLVPLKIAAAISNDLRKDFGL